MPEGTPLHAHDPDTPLVLDELRHQLDQFRILRTGGDDAATIALLDKLGAHDPVEAQLVLELSATRALGHPERFTEAHALAMHALEVLDRNARAHRACRGSARSNRSRRSACSS